MFIYNYYITIAMTRGILPCTPDTLWRYAKVEDYDYVIDSEAKNSVELEAKRRIIIKRGKQQINKGEDLISTNFSIGVINELNKIKGKFSVQTNLHILLNNAKYEMV